MNEKTTAEILQLGDGKWYYEVWPPNGKTEGPFETEEEAINAAMAEGHIIW